MNRWRRARNWLANAVSGRKAVPGIGSRVSVDEGSPYAMMLDTFASSLSGLAAKFPFQFYDVMDWMFMKEPYLGRLLHQVQALGNTGHKLEIAASNEAQAQGALTATNDLAARCYPFGGGADGLVNGMLSQIVRSGATCCEWPATADLARVERAYLIPIKTCRFRRRPDLALEVCQVQLGRLVPLNPVQTTFTAPTMWDDNPNPIPPAITAMKALAKLAKFDESIDGWLNKLSGLGLLMAYLQQPQQDFARNESDADYDARTGKYLDDFVQGAKTNLKGGLAAAFDNVKFEHHNTSQGAAGAKDILQMVLQALFAGLGVDPVFMGWNFNSTETFAKVVFEEMLGKIYTYQLAAKRSMEHGYRLNLALSGLADVGISLRFNPNRSLDAFLGAESWQMEAQAAATLLQADLADRDELRRKLGFDNAPAQSGDFVASFNRVENCYRMLPFKPAAWPGNGLRPLTPPSPARGERNVGAHGARPVQKIPAGRRRYEERQIEYVGTRAENSARDARKAARDYVYQVRGQLSDAGQAGVDAVYEWARLHHIEDEDGFVQEALRRFTEKAEGSLDAATLEQIAKKHNRTIFQWAKYEDDSLFGGGWERRAATIFDAADETATNYLSRVDRLYVSKYISNDELTSRRIQNFMREQYQEKNFGRGTTAKELAQFKDQFGDLSEQITDHRARVIIDTGVSRCQNWGEVLGLHDEAFKVFRIAGPWDSRTCDWCYAIQGKEFKVALEVDRINKIIESGDEDISKFTDFVTSRYGGSAGLERLQGSDAADIQASGMVSAPIHPQCRHRTIAVLEGASSNSRRWETSLVVLAGEWRMAA